MRSMRDAELVAAKPFLIEQDYAKYTAPEQLLWSDWCCVAWRSWSTVPAGISAGWRALGLVPERIPYLPEISERLYRRTGWRVQPVSGLCPRERFSRCWRRGNFLHHMAAEREQMDYILSRIAARRAGHLPMFAEQLCRRVASTGRCARDDRRREAGTHGRLYWYTFEFGLIRQERGAGVRLGRGFIAAGMYECALGGCEISDFSVAEVLKTTVKVDQIHRRLFAIRSLPSYTRRLLRRG